ncbi:substrate-binding domain-containing protein [Clostridium sp. YIM B02515]|uniref:Substrate-binding domain-containing protein n=1 Tax=Clostridium rhizosphaerae TaxID=2803861 RepID=A0ABS1TAN1_9CLOT|nr:substrate-binding domain-containing protein [Clostridium rhizosphaerae]MBL4936404.1 substrate-binding domain-containing protein [Clostridium rhizosphaerae]
MVKRNILIMFLILTIILGATGCYKIDRKSNGQETKTIEFIVKMGGGEHWEMVRSGAQEASKEFNINMNFTAPDKEQDVDVQEKLVESAIERKVDAIVLSSSDYKRMVNVVEKATDNKIPVIIIDSLVDTDKVLSTVSTNNFEAGKQAGNKIAQLVGDNSNIAVMSFVKESESAENREKGIEAALKNYKNINIVAKEYCYSNEKASEELTKNVIQLNKDLNGIVALNSSASLGAARAIEGLGLKGKIKLVTFDSTMLGIQYLEDGVIQATVVQNPFMIGYLGLKYGAMAARGEKIPKNTEIESKVIDEYNMYSEQNQRFIFPFVK